MISTLNIKTRSNSRFQIHRFHFIQNFIQIALALREGSQAGELVWLGRGKRRRFISFITAIMTQREIKETKTNSQLEKMANNTEMHLQGKIICCKLQLLVL